MKITISVSLCSVLLIAAGCSKEDSSSPPHPPATSEASKMVTEQAPASEKAATELSKQVATSAEAAKSAATSLAAEAASKADDLIKQAKSLVGSAQYKDAANIVQQLSSLKLTPEQQKLVDDLKTTIQKALAKQATTEGAKAVGDLLGGKK